ncbi:MAG: 2-amino-4-hydroxy-6-hydroxymethyldihydropteridine diphosphokinase [Legionella sp.]|nr:2-amino-4-hydroxy-6-hydroxymethyldihydropteridine diphosphokinase [Legionella sp.]
MNKCYISLGSNQKYPERQLRQALKNLKNLPSTATTNCSTLYWNKAWGVHKQQDFCNAVVEIQTRLSPLLLLKHCNLIEEKQGRIRKKKYGPRTIDVDIILYGKLTLKTKHLTIPHPRAKLREFVLIPLLEINPSLSLN